MTFSEIPLPQGVPWRLTARKSVFRAAVVRDGVPVADILQVWLDASSHPARGEAQAEEISHRVLAPIFEEKP